MLVSSQEMTENKSSNEKACFGELLLAGRERSFNCILGAGNMLPDNILCFADTITSLFPQAKKLRKRKKISFPIVEK